MAVWFIYPTPGSVKYRLGLDSIWLEWGSAAETLFRPDRDRGTRLFLLQEQQDGASTFHIYRIHNALAATRLVEQHKARLYVPALSVTSDELCSVGITEPGGSERVQVL